MNISETRAIQKYGIDAVIYGTAPGYQRCVSCGIGYRKFNLKSGRASGICKDCLTPKKQDDSPYGSYSSDCEMTETNIGL